MTNVPTFTGRLRMLALAALLPLCVHGASPEPVDDSTLKLDSSIQALKGDVLDIDQRALSIEEDFLYPEYTRITVYFGVKAPGLLLNDLSVTIDDGEPTLHTFDTLEAIVLQRRGLERIVRVNASPGSHRIKATFTGHYADAKPEAPLLRGRYEALFEKTLAPAELEFSVIQENYLAAPTLKLRDWRASK